MKIVINNCYGGYSLSALATREVAKLKGRECFFFDIDQNPIPTPEEADKAWLWHAFDIPKPNYSEEHHIRYEDNRTDPDVISVVEQLGKAAGGRCSDLKIIEIPDDADWEIDEYDGIEKVREKSRSWS